MATGSSSSSAENVGFKNIRIKAQDDNLPPKGQVLADVHGEKVVIVNKKGISSLVNRLDKDNQAADRRKRKREVQISDSSKNSINVKNSTSSDDEEEVDFYANARKKQRLAKKGGLLDEKRKFEEQYLKSVSSISRQQIIKKNDLVPAKNIQEEKVPPHISDGEIELESVSDS